jgi:coenzyme F420-dependent glucose-6-phosphate dehydrogenase
MRRLWTEDHVDHDGEYYKTVGATIYDKPARPVPVYVAAGGPVVARYAGRVGDGFICTSGKGMKLYQEELVPALTEGLEKAGRTPESLDRMIEVKLSYDHDADFALHATRFWAPLSLTAEQKHSVHSSQEMERLADELPIEQVAKRWIVAAKPDEVLEGLKPYIDAGFTNLVFHAPGADQVRFMDQFAADVMPALRALS